MKLTDYVIVLELHLSCFPPKTAQNRQKAMYIGRKERNIGGKARDFFMLDDTAMDFIQGQIV